MIWLKRKCFWKHLESLTCISYHKICFKIDFAENFQVFKKILVFQVSIDRIYFSTDWKILFLDRLKNSIFKAKSLSLFWFLLWFLLISRTYFKIFSILGSIPPDQSNLWVFVFKTLCLSWSILDWCSIDWH